MQIRNRPFFLFTVLAVVAASTLALTGAFAGDEVSSKADATAEKAEAPATKTPSPIHSMMGWMATSVVGDMDSPCPSCPKAETAWRSWFDGGKDVPLAGLRDRLVADGWNADRYIGYFQQMAKSHAKEGGDCGSCDKDCGDCPSKGDCCGSCDKDCGDCPSKSGCDKAGKGCGGCGEKTAKPESQDTAAK